MNTLHSASQRRTNRQTAATTTQIAHHYLYFPSAPLLPPPLLLHTQQEKRTNNQNQLLPHSLQENLEFSITPNSPLPSSSFFDLRSSILLPCSILVPCCQHNRAERTERVQTQREGKKNTCSGLPAGHCYCFCVCLVCLLINTVVHQKGAGGLHKAGEREREKNSRGFFRAKLDSAKSWADRAPTGGFKVAAQLLLLRRAGGELLLLLLQAARRDMQLKGKIITKSGALIQTKQRSEALLQPTSTTNRAVTPASFTYRRRAVFSFLIFYESPNFVKFFPRKYDFDPIQRIFHGKKKETQIRQISKKIRKNPNRQNFKHKFQQVGSQEYLEGF